MSAATATIAQATFLSRSSPLLVSAAASRFRLSPSVNSPSSSRRLSRALSVRASAPPEQPLEVCVKASKTVPNRLGDCNTTQSLFFPFHLVDRRLWSMFDQCQQSNHFNLFSGPFTQRVLLTLEEKHLLYDMKLVDLGNKPDWFLQISPEGKVPLLKLDDRWIADSDIITKLVEEEYPIPPLETPPEKAAVGSKIFSAFIGFLKSKDPNDGTEQALLDELNSFNAYLKDNGPFVNGDNISAVDLSLGPKLYHMEIALGHYKNWSVPEQLAYVRTYMKSIFSMNSFVKTQPLQDDVIAGWRPKVFG